MEHFIAYARSVIPERKPGQHDLMEKVVLETRASGGTVHLKVSRDGTGEINFTLRNEKV